MLLLSSRKIVQDYALCAVCSNLDQRLIGVNIQIYMLYAGHDVYGLSYLLKVADFDSVCFIVSLQLLCYKEIG